MVYVVGNALNVINFQSLEYSLFQTSSMASAHHGDSWTNKPAMRLYVCGISLTSSQLFNETAQGHAFCKLFYAAGVVTRSIR